MYKIIRKEYNGVEYINRFSDGTSISIESINPEYIKFKKEIENETAQLQDVDGNTMTAEQAKEYIKELP